MSKTRQCPQCGAELPREAPEGLCPRCLLSAGLKNTANDQVTAAEAATVARSESDLSTLPRGTNIHYFGDYELLNEIARGGMGVVYKAQQVKLNRTVALKMILAGQLASGEDVKRFRTEAEAAANLQHANIVSIHEVGEHEGQHYFSMDYVCGSSLAEIVRQHPLGAKKAAQYVKTIAEAIHYAHGQGTLHRDLKPSNILIDQSDQPRITDFGLAKRIEGDSKLTSSGVVLGTPSYMPPEQAAANRGLIGPASDVYSLGAVLYELLTGWPPFQAETPLDTLMQVLEQEPVSPGLLNANTPADLVTICLKCLEKRPDARYRTAQELADELGRFLNHEPILSRPAGPIRKLWSWSKRRPWAITAVASLLMLGLLCSAYYLWVENSFLRWFATHADYVKQLGPHTSEFEAVQEFYLFLLMALVSANYFFSHYLRKCRRQRESLSCRLLAAHGLLGAIGIAHGIYFAMKSIDAHIWENHGLFAGLFGVYLCCYFGGMILLRVIREYESITFGSATEPLELSEETLEEIRKIFLDDEAVKKKGLFPFSKRRAQAKNNLQAIILIIKATGFSRWEASIAVEKIQRELNRQHPDKVPPVANVFAASRGLLASMFLFSVPVFCLIILAGMTGNSQILGGTIGFFSAAGATVTYRRNDGQLTRGLFMFALVLLAGSGALTAVLPVLHTVIGSLIGVVVGFGCGIVIPQSRLAKNGG